MDTGSEIFNKRPGTTDKGKEYETITIANMILEMVGDDKITNFHISSNDNNFGAFDDIVIKIESDQSTQVKAMQLKHSERKTLSFEHLRSAKGDFSLNKYFESFQKLKTAVQELIIFTNRPFDVTDDAKFQLEGQKFHVRSVKVWNSSDYFAISKNVNYVYKFEILEDAWTVEHSSEIQEYRTFFEKFSLYANQENFDTLRLSTIEKFKTKFAANEKVFDQFYKIILEWNMREGKKEKLDKKWMKRAIALQLLAPYIEPLSFGPVNDKMKILREAVSIFTVTIIDGDSCKNAKQLWGDVVNDEIDIKEINRIRRNYQLSVDSVDTNEVEKLDQQLVAQLLWLMNKCPLIIRGKDNLEKAIRLCQDQKFILLSDGINEKWMESYSSFRNLSNLRLEQDLYKKIIEKFTVSIQGKEELNLLTAFGENEEFLENVTTSSLMEMLNGPHYIDGKSELLSEPYIERHLSQNLINIDYLGEVDEKTIIILNCSDNFDKVKDKLDDYKLINVDFLSKEKFDESENTIQNDNSYLCNKVIYTCNSKLTESKFQKICTENSEMHTFHYFKITDSGHLEWIRSKGDISDLENYKLSNNCFTHENVLWSPQLQNNINLVISDPGMGKSELMKNFKNKCPPNFWTVTINPEDVNLFLKSFNSNDASNVISLFEKFIISQKYAPLKQLERNFFEICLKQNRVMYIWDALDEIVNEYLDIVSDVIVQLSKRGFVQWVTCRRHLQTFLEKKLKVLSHGLTKFNEKEQQDYIKQRLKSVDEIEITAQKIKSTFSVMEHIDILGIPLQIFMLTELFRRNKEKYLQLVTDKFLLTDVYSSFIEEKFNIFYESKIRYDIQNPRLALKIHDEKQKILKYCEILALKLIFPASVLQGLNINCEKTVEKFVKGNYTMVGIITELQNDVPQFLHESLAEYLVATYFSKNFDEIPVDVFFEQKYNNVRFFFDMLLAENSPVHVAVLYKNFDLVKTYEDEILRRKDNGGRSALHLICSWGQRHPRVEISRENKTFVVEEISGFSCKPESNEVLEAVTFLQSKNDNSERDSLFGLTPLLYARKSESLAVELKLLLLLGKNSEFTYDIDDRINILYYSTLLAYDDVAEVFGPENFFDFITKANHKTPLILASERGHKTIIQYLVKSGVEINHFTNTGSTPLHKASENGHESVVEFLVKSGAEIDRANKNGLTALRVASFNGHQKIVERLVKSGADTNRADNNGFIPLYVASQNGHLQTVKYLVKSAAEIDRPTNLGSTPLHVASQNGHDLIVDFLVKSGAKINLGSKNGFTALRGASLCGHEKTVSWLVKSGAEINRVDNNGLTPLYVASQSGHLSIVKYLVKSGAEIDRSTNTGSTPLHKASENGHDLIVEFLVKSGADLNRADDFGLTALHVAAFNGHEKIVERLVKSGAEVDRPTNLGSTAFHISSQNGHELIVDLLVKSGADVNRVDKNGFTALRRASFNGHEKIVERLVKLGSDINHIDNDGFTPLYVASQNGHLQTVQSLVKSGAEINRSMNIGSTPLHKAAENGHELIVAFLVKSGADINSANKSGLTAVRVASLNGHEKIVECLVKSGADINRADNDGFTPLFLASLNGHLDTVTYLVESGAEVNRCTNSGYTSLDVASQNGHELVVEFLVKWGAEINRANSNGWTPLYLASRNGHLKTVEYLVKYGAEINCPKNSCTPLYIASQNGHDKVVEFLVRGGARVSPEDRDYTCDIV